MLGSTAPHPMANNKCQQWQNILVDRVKKFATCCLHRQGSDIMLDELSEPFLGSERHLQVSGHAGCAIGRGAIMMDAYDSL